MNIKIAVPLIAFFIATLISCSAPVENNNKIKVVKKSPNVVIIVADQMRRAAMGFWSKPQYKNLLSGASDPVITPNLDNLADNGMVFNQAIANFPLCSPFRGMLMSGMYPNKNGVNNNTRKDRPNTGLRIDIDTLTEVFHRAGYNTALVGKAHWQNNLPLFDKSGNYKGSSQSPGGHFLSITDYDTYIPPGPGRQEIEYWYQSIGHDHDQPVIYSNDSHLINGAKDGSPFYPKEYSSVNQANVIIDYIENNREQRDTNKPFSILWSMDPPHNPYEEIEDTDPEIFNKYYKDLAVQELLNRPNVDIETAKKNFRIYFSMITLIDREIGRVINTLKEQGLDKDTLIVFTADHGEMMGSHSKMAKNVVYEESLSIPLIMNYPKGLPHQVNDLLIGVPDFMPTILGLVGLEEQIPKNIHGVNYANYLTQSDNKQVKPKSSLYIGKASELGVRTDQYTYAINKNGNLIALFDNIKDPYQLSLLALSEIPVADQNLLKDELGYWLKKIDHEWYKNQKYTTYIKYPNK